MKITLPIIGTIQAGKHLTNTAPIKKEKSLIGGFLNLGTKKLSNEKAISEKLLESYAGWVYINSSTLAEEVSKMDLKLYESRYVNGGLELAEVENHELLDLLDRFNESTTSSDAFYLTEAHTNLTGDAFWYLANQTNGKPSDIFLLRPDKMTIKLGDITDSSRRLIDGYTYKDVVDGKAVTIEYAPEDILPFKTPNPSNPYRGKSTVEAVANDIDTDNYAGVTLREFFENGMIIQFALSTEQRVNNDQIKNYQSQLNSAYGGAKNAWKVPIFGGGIKPVELQMSSKDMELLAQMKWLRDKIMLAFKNTPASLGIVEDVNRANAEASLLSWKQTVIEPKIKRIVDNLNEFLVPRYGDNLILGFESPVPEDVKVDKDQAILLYKGGLITRNEARAIIDYDEVSGGDEFTSSGFQSITSPAELPKAIKNINWKKAFRKQGVFAKYKEYRAFYKKNLPIAKKLLESKRKTEEPVKERPTYSYDYTKVDKYASSQLKIVDHHESIFKGKLEQVINSMVEEAVINVGRAEARKSGKLIDKEKWLEEAVNKLQPTLEQVAILAGNQANHLIGIENPYIPKAIKALDVRNFIRDQVLLFMGSAIDTDVDIITDILATGLSEELGIATIRRRITSKFEDYTKNQAERITRTEVIKTSNLGAQDAFEQSGVVEAKQWLATEDDRTDEECTELDGKIVGLEDNYFEKGDKFMGLSLDYSDTPYPPLHPNCRCVILPVLVGEKGFANKHILEDQKAKIMELEEKIDKRTKDYKELKIQKTDDLAYIKSLEQYLGLSDEQTG